MTILCIKYVDLKCFPYTKALWGNFYETGEFFSLEDILLDVMIKCSEVSDVGNPGRRECRKHSHEEKSLQELNHILFWLNQDRFTERL